MQLLKLKSTYVDGMMEAMEGGALHTHWDQTAAATGRLASSHPNLQAIPKTPTTITGYEDDYIVGEDTSLLLPSHLQFLTFQVWFDDYW